MLRAGIRSGFACVVVVVVASTVMPAGALSGGTAWVRPVEGAVLRPFEEPLTRFSAGHRGVKLSAAPGTPVRAAGPGTVAFAGQVGGALHVVVAHVDGLRTSYSYLGSISVRRGDVVEAGEVVATTGNGPHEPPHSLHFGLRSGDTYLDPMLLFDPRDPADVVALVPVPGDAPLRAWTADDDRRYLLAEFAEAPDWAGAPLRPGPGGGGGWGPLGAVGDAVGALWGGAGDVADRTVAMLAGGADAAVDAAALAADLAAVGLGAAWEWAQGNIPAFKLAADLAEMAGRFVDWLAHRASCDDDAPAADGTGGSGHSLVAVAGINSAGGDGDASFALDVDALGYESDEIHYFSYAADGARYEASDTRGDLHRAAARLAEQIRERQRVAPGREVDLIAHSQGGVVVALFLRDHYDPSDVAYPPLGTVVTLAAPHEGAPIASAGDLLGRTRLGSVLLEGTRRHLDGVPVGESMTQLSEHSGLMRELWTRSPYEQLQVTSLGGSEDVVVPANRTDIPGATVVTMAVGGWNDHSNIVDDPGALRAVRAALERRAQPCVGFVDGVRGSVAPVIISRVETELGEWAARGALVAGGG